SYVFTLLVYVLSFAFCMLFSIIELLDGVFACLFYSTILARVQRYLHSFPTRRSSDLSYGLDVRAIAGGTVVRPSLLRGARFPDPGSDLGRHRMAYAVVAGDLAATIDAAYEVNAPVLELPEIEPLLELDLTEGTAAVDWIKLAEDGSGDVIVRIAELAGGRA